MEIAVTETPVSLAAALGVMGANAWAGRAQMLDQTGEVYHVRSATAPAPATVRGFRRSPGETFPIRFSGDLPAWLWTAPGDSATVIVEAGEFR